MPETTPRTVSMTTALRTAKFTMMAAHRRIISEDDFKGFLQTMIVDLMDTARREIAAGRADDVHRALVRSLRGGPWNKRRKTIWARSVALVERKLGEGK